MYIILDRLIFPASVELSHIRTTVCNLKGNAHEKRNVSEKTSNYLGKIDIRTTCIKGANLPPPPPLPLKPKKLHNSSQV